MWELNPPFEHDWDHHLEGRKPKYTPTSRDEALLKNGEDLIATMAFARRSLGLALCYGVAADPLSIGNNEEFWQEYATTMMWLNIASERLREFSVMVRFSKKAKQYREHWRSNHPSGELEYSTPFKEAAQGEASGISKSLAELAILSERLQEHRSQRNKLVHQISTITAQRSVYLLREQRRIANNTNSPTATAMYQESLPTAIEDLKLWFGQMMRAASLVFEFEYDCRVKL